MLIYRVQEEICMYAGIAQSVVQLIRNQQVSGSIPLTSSNTREYRKTI